jgi:hypothetical protein
LAKSPDLAGLRAGAGSLRVATLGAVSVAGKRNFEARDKGAEIALGSRELGIGLTDSDVQQRRVIISVIIANERTLL